MGGRKVYSIRGWNESFEKAQSRKIEGALPWVALPTKHDGKGFRRIMQQKNGPAIYAAWVLLLQIAAKCPDRGVLCDDDGPLDSTDFELKTDCPAKLFDEALQVLASPKVAWILVAEWEGDGSVVALHDMTVQDSTRHDITLDSSSEPAKLASKPEPALLTFPTVGKSKEWHLTQPLVNTLAAAFPHLDILAECRKALAWAEVNPGNRKTPEGMPKFLNGWMGRAQNSGRAGPNGRRVAVPETVESIFGPDR